jgi:putative DNA primase/helicase
MYPEGEYENPNAVTCVHVSEGSIKPQGLGWLHILDPARNKTYIKQGFNPKPNLPILVVEGASDVCAAYDIGLTAVGRPSAQGGNKLLAQFLPKSHNIVVVGENDAGVGITGMESLFIQLKKDGFACTKVLPPTNIKDLRQWINTGLTQSELLDYIEKSGESALSPDVFEDGIAYTVAKAWLKQTKTLDGNLLLRNFNGDFFEFDGHYYKEVSSEGIRGQLYEFLANKSYIGDDKVVKVYKPTRSKISDILDACNAFCPIDQHPPVWLDDKEHSNPCHLLVFQNGILDVQDHFDGQPKLNSPTPNLFIVSIFPYDYYPDASSELYESYINNAFSNEEDVRVWHQWLGYNLIPDTSQEKLMMLIGPTRSGKSTLINVLRKTLGINQCMSTNYTALANKHGCASLEYKLAATIGDVRMPPKSITNLALDTMLKITGGDSVPIEPKFKQQYEAHLRCRFTIGMNNLPAFSDSARAFVARSLILNLPHSYVGKEDTTLKKRLEAEAASGKLINYALNGLKDLWNQGRFTIPKSSEPFIEELEEITAPVTAFTKQYCDVDYGNPSVFISKDNLFSAWRYWCGKSNRTVGSIEYFTRYLYHANPELTQVRQTVDGRPVDVIKGIKLKDWVYNEFS